MGVCGVGAEDAAGRFAGAADVADYVAGGALAPAVLVVFRCLVFRVAGNRPVTCDPCAQIHQLAAFAAERTPGEFLGPFELTLAGGAIHAHGALTLRLSYSKSAETVRHLRPGWDAW